MPNIIGEPLRTYVKNQIKQRQIAHGSGVYGSRTPEQLSYLNSKTAWVKLASGISVDENRANGEKLRSSLSWGTLAKQHVLFSGVSSLKGNTLVPRGISGYLTFIYLLFKSSGVWIIGIALYLLAIIYSLSSFSCT